MSEKINTKKYQPVRPLKEDEYFNEEDGLIYCRKCHTPRQCRRRIPGGREIVPDILCRCLRKELEKEEAEQKEQDSLRELARMKADGLRDIRLYDYNFSNDAGINPELRHAHTYVENWPYLQRRGMGLLLWGSVGSGKTFFAACIANALIEKKVPVLMTNLSQVLNDLTALYPGERKDYFDYLDRFSLLILDDLGIERNSEFAQEQTFNVIDSWYCSNKPMIVTTNLTLDELKQPDDIMRAKIYSRILERCVPIRINNRNIREENAAKNLHQAKNLFT